MRDSCVRIKIQMRGIEAEKSTLAHSSVDSAATQYSLKFVTRVRVPGHNGCSPRGPLGDEVRQGRLVAHEVVRELRHGLRLREGTDGSRRGEGDSLRTARSALATSRIFSSSCGVSFSKSKAVWGVFECVLGSVVGGPFRAYQYCELCVSAL